MAFYYVKSGGTATGDSGRYASKQTGSFATIGASGYYNDLADAIGATTAPTGGDYILISDASDNSTNYTTNTTLTLNFGGARVAVWSVSDTNCDQYSPGAIEGSTSGMVYSGAWDIRGVTLKADFNYHRVEDNSWLRAEECTFDLTGTSGQVQMYSDGAYLELINSDIKFSPNTSAVTISYGATINWYGGTLVDTTAAGLNQLTNGGFNNGGGTLRCYGVDLSAVEGTLISTTGATPTADDTVWVELNGCKLNGSRTGDINEAMSSPTHRVTLTNCFTAATTGEHQITDYQYTGTLTDQTTIFRDETTAYPGGDKVAWQLVTNASCNRSNQFAVDRIAIYAELSAVATDALRFYFASTATLTDNDICAHLIYKDGTTGVAQTHVTNRNANPLAAGTAWTDDSAGSTWKNGASDLTGYNEYYMDVTTSADSGADCVPKILIEIGIASTTIYLDPIPDLV